MDLNDRVAQAVKQFWTKRESQATEQAARGTRDQGSRGTVTGGGHLNGFIHLMRDLLIAGGCDEGCIVVGSKMEVPGYFRPTKKWDLLVISKGRLLAAVETKSHVGSFGNNANNRTEEALGNAVDLWTAFREGKFQKLPRPWLGWLMLLEQKEGSTKPGKAPKEPYFKVFPEFRGASYQKRYELLCERLVQEKLYDGSCLIVSDKVRGAKSGLYDEPNAQLTFEKFAKSLVFHVINNQ